jgi:hypothetical protein
MTQAQKIIRAKVGLLELRSHNPRTKCPSLQFLELRRPFRSMT